MFNSVSELETHQPPADMNTLNTKVNDIFSTEYILTMPNNSALFLTVGVGGGKSYFGKHNLYDAACRKNTMILYVINRRNPLLQFKEEIEASTKNDRITIITYQAIEATYKVNKEFDFSLYKYIVFDEYHRFASDSVIDKYTDLVLEATLNIECTRFFLSATPRGVDAFIKSELKKRNIFYQTYTLPSSYKMMDINVFQKNEHLISIANKILMEKCKGIFFISSAEEALELHRKFFNVSMFVCSEQNSKYVHVNSSYKEYMISQERLPVPLLFTTTCLDIGFNLKDTDIKYVVCDLDDIDQIIQCIGRRRVLDADDKFHVYVRDLREAEIRDAINKWMQRIERASFLLNNGVKQFNIKYGILRDFNTERDLIYPDNDINGNLCLKVMMMPYLYYTHRISRYQEILDSGKNYESYVRSFFGCASGAKVLLHRRQKRYELLRSYVGLQIIGVKDCRSFYKALGYWDSSRNLITNTDQLNSKLQRDKLPFVIREDKVRNKQTNGLIKRIEIFWKD